MLFSHGFRWPSETAQIRTLEEFTRQVPAGSPDIRPTRSVPVQRAISEAETLQWRFYCRTCRRDLQVSNRRMFTLFRGLADRGMTTFDISRVS